MLVKDKMDQWNRIESPDIDPHENRNLTFDKKQRQYKGAKVAFQQVILKQLDIYIQKKKKKNKKEINSKNRSQT